MADPKQYTQGYDFSDFSSHNPNSQQPGDRMDVEFANIQESTKEIVDAIKDVRRADGALKNGIVTQDSLAAGLLSTLPTAAQMLASLLTVDGSGSGLDADLLDGHNSGYFQVQSANLDAWSAVAPASYLTVAAAAAAYQPVDSDLTAIAALSTTAYGRGLLALANQAALIAEVSSAYQPIDSDLTAIAALSTTSHGRALLTKTAGEDVRLAEVVPTYVASRTALKALDTTKDTVAVLTESGRTGTFYWHAANHSADVTADTAEGIYIKANAIASSSGAWVRSSSNEEMMATWFGVIADYSTASDTGTDNSAAITAAVDMAVYLGRPLRFPAGNIRVASKIDRSYSTNVMLTMRGVNQRETIFYVRGVENSSGFFKLTATTIGADVRIEMSDFLVGNRGDASTHMNCGTAIELVRDPVPSLRFYTEVHIYDVDTYTYNNADGYFDKGIVLTGWRYPIVERCRLEGTPAGPTVSGAVDRHQDTWAGYLATVGFDFENCYGPQAILCHCRSVKTGYVMNSATGEGGDLLMSTAVDVKIGLFKDGLDNEPGFKIDGNHFNYRDYGVKIGHGKFFLFSNIVFYNENVGTNGVAIPADFYFVEFDNTMTVSDCISHFDGANAAARRFIYAAASGTGRAIICSNNGGVATLAAVVEAITNDIKITGSGNMFPNATKFLIDNGNSELMDRRLTVSGGFTPGVQSTPTAATNKSSTPNAWVVEHEGDVAIQILGGTANTRRLVFSDSNQIDRAEFQTFSNSNTMRLLFLGVEYFRWDNTGIIDIKAGATPAYKMLGTTVVDSSLGLRLPSYTAAQILDKTHAVNTTDKAIGKLVRDSTNLRVMCANGTAVTSTWTIVDGSVTVTPV
jgi:hypothetical protein